MPDNGHNLVTFGQEASIREQNTYMGFVDWCGAKCIEAVRVMRLTGTALILLGAAAFPAAAQAENGVSVDTALADARQTAACETVDANAGGTHALITVNDIATDEGNLRVQVYSDKEEEFLESGKRLLRVEVKAKKGSVPVCLEMPGRGDYSIVVLHDRNGNGKADFFTEGFAFTNNPKLLLSKPDHEDTLVSFNQPLTEVQVGLQYVIDQEKPQAKRRKRR